MATQPMAMKRRVRQQLVKTLTAGTKATANHRLFHKRVRRRRLTKAVPCKSTPHEMLQQYHD